MTRKKAQKKITLSEFKTWLAGVQSMQPDDWHPNEENWKMILEQIDNIRETVIEKEIVKEVVPSTQPRPSHGLASRNNPANFANPANPANPANAPLPEPLPTTLIPPSPEPTPTATVGKPAGNNGVIAVDIPKTDGSYASSFAE